MAATEHARAIEAILMVAQEPVEPNLLAQLLEVGQAVVEQTVADLQAAYEAEGRGFELVKVAGGYRFQSAGDLTAYVERFALEGQSARLSNAALETLAIVAYKQPLSRAQVAAIRGVNVDGVMRTLQQRGYIEEVGRDDGPGQATLFGTSREFLERLGLDSLDDLPAIAELFPSADVMEALEKTLRATPAEDPAPVEPEPEGERVADADGNVTVLAEAVEVAGEATPETAPDHPTPGEGAPASVEVDPFAFVDPGDDDVPEPEPPAWAVDPPGATDVDGDGLTDLPAEP